MLSSGFGVELVAAAVAAIGEVPLLCCYLERRSVRPSCAAAELRPTVADGAWRRRAVLRHHAAGGPTTAVADGTMATSTGRRHIDDVASCGRVGQSAEGGQLGAAVRTTGAPLLAIEPAHSSSWSSPRNFAAAALLVAVGSAPASAAVVRTAAAAAMERLLPMAS